MGGELGVGLSTYKSSLAIKAVYSVYSSLTIKTVHSVLTRMS